MNTEEMKTAIRFARDSAMTRIMNMGPNQFIWALLCDSLPEFDRAEQGDDDYCSLFRTSGFSGAQNAYACRQALRCFTTSEFIDNFLWANDDDHNQKIRNLAMDLILAMPRQMWLDKVEQREYPLFVRATPASSDFIPTDSDMTDMSQYSDADDYYDKIRPMLRVMEYYVMDNYAAQLC